MTQRFSNVGKHKRTALEPVLRSSWITWLHFSICAWMTQLHRQQQNTRRDTRQAKQRVSQYRNSTVLARELINSDTRTKTRTSKFCNTCVQHWFSKRHTKKKHGKHQLWLACCESKQEDIKTIWSSQNGSQRCGNVTWILAASSHLRFRSCSSLPGGRCPRRDGVAGSTGAFLGEGYGRARCVQRQVLAVTVLKTVEVSAVAVHRPAGQTSTEGYGRKNSYFPRDGELGSRGRCTSCSSKFPRAPCIWQSLRVQTSATKAFGRVSFIQHEGGLVQRSILPAGFAHWTRTLFPRASWGRLKGSLPHFAAFFALRSPGRECPFFSPRWRRVLRRRGLGVAGTPGVWLPGELPSQFGAYLRRSGKTLRRPCLVRTTTTTTTTTTPPHPTPPHPTPPPTHTPHHHHQARTGFLCGPQGEPSCWHGCWWRRDLLCDAEEAVTSASHAEAWGADRRDRARCSPASQPWCRAWDVRRPSGTEDSELGAGARRPDAAGAAGRGQSWSVTWLPQCRCWPCCFLPARQVRQSTLAPSPSSSRGRLPRRSRRRRRGGRRWRSRLRGSAPRSMPSMRRGTGPLPPPGRGGRGRRGGSGAFLEPPPRPSRCRKLWRFRGCCSSTSSSSSPVVAQRLYPHGRDSPVSRVQGVLCPCYAGLRVPQVDISQSWRRGWSPWSRLPWRFPSSSSTSCSLSLLCRSSEFQCRRGWARWHEDRSRLVVGPCAQAQGKGWPPPLGRGRGAGVAGSFSRVTWHPNSLHARDGVSTKTNHQHNVHTTTTTTSHLAQAFPLLLCNLSRVDGQRAAHERCSASQRVTTALVVATRAAVDHRGSRRSPPPQRWTVEEEGGGKAREARGGRERDVLRPTETEDPTSGNAAGASAWGGRAAGSGSHGRSRGCRGSSPHGVVASWRRRRRRHRC